MTEPRDAVPRVSVVIPAYNAGKSLGACLDALAAQTLPPPEFEVIVVDDGSTDNTAEVAARHTVRLLRQPNRGPAAARNRGAAEARGEILLFTDSDCVPDPDWVEAMAAAFDSPDVAAAKGVYRTEQKSLTARFAQVEFEERYERLARAGRTDMVDTYCAGFRTRVFRDCGGFDESFPIASNEDTDLSYRLSEGGLRLVFHPAAVVRHLAHPAGPAAYWRLKVKRGYWRMAVYRKFPGKILRETYTPPGLKLQILATGLGLGGAALLPAVPAAGLAVLAGAAVLGGAAALPLARVALRHDRAVCAALPFFVLLRATALGLGAVAGLLCGGRSPKT